VSVPDAAWRSAWNISPPAARLVRAERQQRSRRFRAHPIRAGGHDLPTDGLRQIRSHARRRAERKHPEKVEGRPASKRGRTGRRGDWRWLRQRKETIASGSPDPHLIAASGWSVSLRDGFVGTGVIASAPVRADRRKARARGRPSHFIALWTSHEPIACRSACARHAAASEAPDIPRADRHMLRFRSGWRVQPSPQYPRRLWQ